MTFRAPFVWFGGKGGRGDENAAKERLWFSPLCLDHARQGVLI